LQPMFEGAMSFGGVDQTDLTRSYVASAARFEPGTPLLLTSIAAAASISCFQEFGVENIRSQNILLRNHLIQGLQKLDAKIFGTLDSQNSGPHVTFIPRKNVDDCKRNLDLNHISYVTKIQGLRFSPHAFNSFDDLDRALDCLKI
jgi:cysteine desulfurase/selenocysteine lyase